MQHWQYSKLQNKPAHTYFSSFLGQSFPNTCLGAKKKKLWYEMNGVKYCNDKVYRTNDIRSCKEEIKICRHDKMKWNC